VSDADLANLSDKLMLTTVVMYVVALAAYAVDLGFGRRRAAAEATEKPEAKVLVGASGATAGTRTRTRPGTRPRASARRSTGSASRSS
jgi:hypothetical protein